MGLAAESARNMASSAGLIVLLSGELDRRVKAGATKGRPPSSLGWWSASESPSPTARAFAHVGGRLYDLPQLADALSAGELSFDKVRAVVDAATPESDAEFRDRAKEHSVPRTGPVGSVPEERPQPSQPERTHDARSLRFNESFRTPDGPPAGGDVRRGPGERSRLRPAKSLQTARHRDQRLCDAFVGIVRSSRSPGHATPPFTVVAHVPLATLIDETSELPGELERDGLISADTVRRVACDATLILAVDDNVGHTMYEGRRHRYPTTTQRRELMRRDRHCRFPGGAHAIFVNPHHIRWWKPHRGTTDLPNLALVCEHHHHLVHSKQWSVSGDANQELTFVGPTGRIMTSRPSPLWTTVSQPTTPPESEVG